MKILLMGNPNVGKSVIFSGLTGINAVSSNFAGTTVTFTEGKVTLGNSQHTMIDVPGTYSMKPSSKAESVAAEFAEKGADAIICVLDASNLERNLCLALELQRYKIPIIYSLNLMDVAERRGLLIDEKLLSRKLSAPVIPTVAVKKQGFDELKAQLNLILTGDSSSTGAVFGGCKGCEACPDNTLCGGHGKEHREGDYTPWSSAKLIAKSVTKRSNGIEAGFLDKLGNLMMKPFPGIPIAVVIISALMAVVIGGGKFLEEIVLSPLIEAYVVPFFTRFFSSFIPEGMLLNILVGEFGVFVISFEWIIALILPYVFLFYVAFSFLEDSGYLPRISVLFDNVMRKIGVQGGSLIYAVMGFGCAVPAIIGSRAATSRKERVVISTAICFAVPCISQTGALISLMSAYSWWMFPALVALGIFLFMTSSLIAGKMVKGRVDPILIEVPNLLLPEPRAYGRKLLIRMKHFFMEAELPMLTAIVIAAVLKESGMLQKIAVAAEPIMSQWLGMPREAVIGLILGFIRREMSVAPLLSLELTHLQAFIGGAVSLMYLPCLSVFAVLVKEFKLKTAVLITVTTTLTALLIGGLINQIAKIFV